ncbi:hypothetical protein MA16_Dca006792 [Dendrobium catenatum]|uniref:Uncharacterized protein n=1 Tax=Dendrobium catenatum TaxID=906689 RepID=A0A2I0W958_9ASPA|nr:hypothetical protein MA16_Dca006792 [Dendrobium catenatum]
MNDLQGRVNILRSPFFNLNLEIDHTVNNYVDQILFTLTSAIEKHQISRQWRVIQHPPTHPPPARFSLGYNIGDEDISRRFQRV